MIFVIYNMKNKWMKDLEQEVLSRGFQKIEQGYELIKNVQQPGQTISINGRVMHQPGKTIEIKQTIVFNGEGWVGDENEENKKEFTQIKFKIEQNGQEIGTFEEGFYWDDIDHFKYMFNTIFK